MSTVHSYMSAVVVVLISSSVFVTVTGQAPGAEAFRQENTPANLQALLQRAFGHIHVEKSIREGAALYKSLLPDERRLKRALRDDLPPETLRKVLEFHKRFADAPDEEVARFARPEQTVVRVHGASTEEIRKYQEGSVAFAQFPGGARQMAEQVLRPGTTFYEVEFLEPGQELGIKHHLFYWDGQQWSMLGPLWRVVQSPNR